MKKYLRKRSESELLERYPVKGTAKGWYFRATETSNNAWEVEGVDRWGRQICLHGGDPDSLLEEANIEAERISSELDST
ncbi:MAG: hypothetical protein ACRES7_04255 [Gammaproteobacteria bacterium]